MASVPARHGNLAVKLEASDEEWAEF